MDLKTLLALEELNQLTLTDTERERVIAAFERMSSEEAKLAAIDTSNVERMVHVVPLTNVLRDDVSSQPFTREDLLEGAPEHTDGYWQVPRLID